MIFSQIISYAGYIFIIAGSVFLVIGAIGMLRMPDFYTRLHAAGISDSLAVPMILFGLFLLEGFNLFALKYIILIFLLYITSPTATHALAKFAALSDLKPYKRSKGDD